MKRDISFLLDDVLGSIELIEDSLNNLNKEGFLKDRLIQDATVRRLEIIGEAARNIPQNIKEKYPEIEWKDIIGTRDKISHHYFGINFDLVWEIITEDLPNLKKKMERIIKEIKTIEKK